MNKEVSLIAVSSTADATARVVAVISLDNFNSALATVIAVLSIVSLVIRLRKELRDK